MHFTFLHLALLSVLLLLDPASALGGKKKGDAILLSNVKTLTLYASKQTSHRRVSAIPQLTCTGPGCAHHKSTYPPCSPSSYRIDRTDTKTVDIMRCTNQGADYSPEDIQWSCTASLPEEFKLGETEVMCEGYDSADDERVLKGSCGVRYRLLLTEKGEERYGTTWWGGSKISANKGMQQSVSAENDGMTFVGVVFILLFVGVAAWILYAMYLSFMDTSPTHRQPRRRGNGRGGGWGGGPGGGGGGGGAWDDPPPPYPGKRYNSTPEREPWRPGFWTGVLGGAGAGYAAGRAGRDRREPPPVQRNSGWFGGNDYGSGSGWGAGPSRSPGSGSGSGSSRASGSGTKYEATGFGSTTRR
jgi:hypothetical protein